MSKELIERLRHEIGGWEQAYPLSAFPEPDLKRAAAVLKDAGMTLDAISASNMRHVVSCLAPLIHEAIAALDATPLAEMREENERLREAGQYLLRVLDCRADPCEVYLATAKGNTIFSIADARAALGDGKVVT